jgi:hypothetical protein
MSLTETVTEKKAVVSLKETVTGLKISSVIDGDSGRIRD